MQSDPKANQRTGMRYGKFFAVNTLRNNVILNISEPECEPAICQNFAKKSTALRGKSDLFPLSLDREKGSLSSRRDEKS
jgi:hypothetical protein